MEALNAVHGFIAEKIREMPQNVAKTEPVSILQPQTTVNPDRIKQVSCFFFCMCVFEKRISCVRLNILQKSLRI